MDAEQKQKITWIACMALSIAILAAATIPIALAVGIVAARAIMGGG